jgi:hypothetical protein
LKQAHTQAIPAFLYCARRIFATNDTAAMVSVFLKPTGGCAE